MRRLLRVISAVILAAGVGTAHAAPMACPVPEDLALTGMHLPAVKSAITARKMLTILTVGGSSTAGLMAKGGEYTYPARLAAHLRQSIPGLAVEVINRGQQGGSTRARVDRLATDLQLTHPDIVVWAPGSTEAGMSEDPGAFIDSLQEGVTVIRAARADLILIDLQWAPSIARVVNLSQYNNAIAGVAANEDVPVLRRSELMRRWNDDGTLRFDGTQSPAQRTDDIRRLFDCIAATLAAGIVEAAK